MDMQSAIWSSRTKTKGNERGENAKTRDVESAVQNCSACGVTPHSRRAPIIAPLKSTPLTSLASTSIGHISAGAGRAQKPQRRMTSESALELAVLIACLLYREAFLSVLLYRV